jgi:ABC-type nitrate/sulfonate/bicarbonate transport system permease component
MPSPTRPCSIPMIAMTPLIALLFGRGLLAVTVIVGLVTFFPTLVAVTTAMRNAPRQACELVAAYGGSQARELLGVRLPFAVPSLFAAAKIALPAAIGGALLAEWLATGQGLGSLMLRASASSQFTVVWAGAAVIVAASIACYALVGAIESRVARGIGAQT